jgi:hypothetical protein
MKKRKLRWLLFPAGILAFILPHCLECFMWMPTRLFEYAEAIGFALIVSTPFAIADE